MCEGKKMMASEPGPNTTHKRWPRASKACIVCRSRKVRCDASVFGTPCTNCRFGNIECRLPGTIKKKKGYNLTTTTWETTPPERLPHFRSDTKTDGVNANILLDYESSQRLSRNNSTSSWSQESVKHPNVTSVSNKNTTTILLDHNLQCSLLGYYLDWVHPEVPFLDVHSVAEKICNPLKAKETNPLLLHAILFAGSLYSREEDFHQTSFSSKRSAQEALYHKSKILYENASEADPDPLILSQSALLLCLWNDDKFSSYETRKFWLNRSIGEAHALIVRQHWYCDQNSTRPHGSQVSSHLNNTIQQLSWSIHLRELKMALESEDLPEIKMYATQITPLDTQLLIPRKWSKRTFTMLSASALVRYPHVSEVTAELFIARTKLANLMCEVLQTVRWWRKAQLNAKLGSPRCSLQVDLAAQLAAYETAMNEWSASHLHLLQGASLQPLFGETLPSRVIWFHNCLLVVTCVLLSTTITQARLMADIDCETSTSTESMQGQRKDIVAKIRGLTSIVKEIRTEDVPRLISALCPETSKLVISALIYSPDVRVELGRSSKKLQLIVSCVKHFFGNEESQGLGLLPLSSSQYFPIDSELTNLFTPNTRSYCEVESTLPHFFEEAHDGLAAKPVDDILTFMDQASKGEASTAHLPIGEASAPDPSLESEIVGKGADLSSGCKFALDVQSEISTIDARSSSTTRAEEDHQKRFASDYLIPMSLSDDEWIEFDE